MSRTLRIAGITVFCLTALSGVRQAQAQTDTTTHGWPVTPFFDTHPSTGVFGEFRNTLTSDHFHNGVDVPKPDGSPAYPVFDGVVSAIGTVPDQGDNAYVRVNYRVYGLLKSDAYVHIAPNPLLNVGDSVYAYQTVLGNILPGLGHVHFTNGTSPYMNAIRPVGGFAPYLDTYPPRILSVRFFLDESSTEFTGGRVSGPVDIRVHIAETSAGRPGDLTSSTTNNGTYLAGYRILSADTATVVFEPPSGGVRYRFDKKPSDSYVDRVYAPGSDLSTHIYTLTNGDGADYINTTQIVNNNAWNTALLPVGDYVVMIFTVDTRGLGDTLYVPVQVTRQDVVPPAAPVLRSVINDSTRKITLSWDANADADLRGYRLFFSVDGTTWTQKENESVLDPAATAISYRNVAGTNTIFFRLAAVDSAAPPNVSAFSDVYGVRLNASMEKTLIVDGFDRTEPSGSYHAVSHPFAMTYGMSDPLDFSTCANDAIIDSSVHLEDFDVVFWLLGDESEHDETFSPLEQEKVKNYLRSGGRLCVSGSEIAYDLDGVSSATASDRDFLHSFLKVQYAGDDANEYSVVGVPSTPFGDLAFRYGVVAEGSPYEEDWPDYFSLSGGSTALLLYDATPSPLIAGAGFSGLFPGGTSPGGVVTIGFPFETMVLRTNRDSLMRRVFRFFDIGTEVGNAGATLPAATTLAQNFPNPFNPTTTIRFSLAGPEIISLTVFDLLGRSVAVLAAGRYDAGEHTVRFDAHTLASGVYFYQLRAGTTVQTRSLMVLK